MVQKVQLVEESKSEEAKKLCFEILTFIAYILIASISITVIIVNLLPRYISVWIGYISTGFFLSLIVAVILFIIMHLTYDNKKKKNTVITDD